MNFYTSPSDRAGIVLMPTGAGKTVCFQFLIEQALRACDSSAKKLRIAILHPRIMLSQEQHRRIRKSLNRRDVRFMSFHSGKHISAVANEENSTEPTDWERQADHADREDQHFITMSSYDSFFKLTRFAKFDLTICDEAHNLSIGEGFSELVINDAKPELVSLAKMIHECSDKVLFYTATPRFADDSCSTAGTMSDKAIYGSVIYQVPPKALHKDGYLVRPYVNFLYAYQDKADEARKNSLFKIEQIIVEAYVEQYRQMVDTGNGENLSSMPYHKMLVATQNVTNDHTRINSKIKFIKDELMGRLGVDLDIVTISSAGIHRNGISSNENREAVISDIDVSSRNTIVVHYDTLAEGIDVNTLGGALILRSLGKLKFIQTVGRPARPASSDLINGEPVDEALRKKRRFPVTLVVWNGENVAGEKSLDIIQWLLEAGYDHLAEYMNTDLEDEATGSKPCEDGEDPGKQMLKDIVLSYNEMLFLNYMSL